MRTCTYTNVTQTHKRPRSCSYHHVKVFLDITAATELFGEADPGDGDKVLYEWYFQASDGRWITPYDYKRSAPEFHIGSDHSEVGPDAAQAFETEFAKWLVNMGIARFVG